MSNARKRKARHQRRAVQRTERIKPTPETAAKLKPHPLEVLLARGREGGGIDADQLQCAEEIIDAAGAITRGLAYAHADLVQVNYALGGHGHELSPHEERLALVWSTWAGELLTRLALKPFTIVELIAYIHPADHFRISRLQRALDLWAKVRRDLSRPPREVSTIWPNHA